MVILETIFLAANLLARTKQSIKIRLTANPSQERMEREMETKEN